MGSRLPGTGPLAASSALVACLSVPMVSGTARAEWRQDGGRYVLEADDLRVSWTPPGTLWAGRGDGPGVSLAFFLWHDQWIYERLDRGTAEAGPEVAPDGSLRQAGLWGTTDGAPPVRYWLRLCPENGRVRVRLEVEKTAELKLTSGVWCTLGIDRKRVSPGMRLYARPQAHGLIGRAVASVCDALLVEQSTGKAVAFDPQGYRSMRSRISETNHGVEMNLIRDDFGVGQRVALDMTVCLEDMPSEFPGEIKPGREPLAIRGAAAKVRDVPLYALLELAVDLRGRWDNPFDPDDVTLDADVTTASGRTYTLPGFFTVGHGREVHEGAEVMVPQDNGHWLVRLAATEVGPLRCSLRARDRSGTVAHDAGTFEVVPSRRRGFLRQSPADPHYFAYDDGSSYVPVGHNLPIYPTSGQLAEEAIRKMAEAGENWNRWWMSNHGLGIEWEEHLGWYRQAEAARLDAMLRLADELSFTYMLCMDTHQDFRTTGWEGNPFNKANGGPCETVKDWFTNADAKAFYKRRLRYTVARWTWSPQVLCWEFGNEFEGWADTDQETKIAWHREMAEYLAGLDPYHHLLTTSWWSKTGPESCWQIPEHGIVQTHCYTNNDASVARQVRDYCLHQWQRFDKPHVFGEFGIRSHSTTADKDPKGWALHNAFWVAVCSGCCGVPMPWWHRNYIDALDLYFHFTAIRRFTDGLPFGTARWEQVTVGQPEYIDPPSEPVVRDLVITPADTWGKPAVNEFRPGHDGTVNDRQSIHRLLHGNGHRDLRNPPTFLVENSRPWAFTVAVGRVSSSGTLRVWLDGQVAVDKEFPCGEGIGKESVYREKWKLWESVYDEDVTLDIPAGVHRIRVENLGKDWMRVNQYVFSDYQHVDRPAVLAAALRTADTAVVWLQNEESTWYNHGREQVAAVPPSRVPLLGFEDGAYRVEWWETWKGEAVRTETVRASGGRLTLMPGAIPTDVAAKITRQ